MRHGGWLRHATRIARARAAPAAEGVTVPVCAYVIVPRAGEKEVLAATLSAMADCEVIPAVNEDVLLLVTTAPDFATDAALRDRVESLPAVHAMLLTFGEVHSEPGDDSRS